MAINPMQAPIDYLGQMGIRPSDPGTALLEGLQLGAVFKQQRQARELERKNAQFQADMSAWRMNPTDDRIVELMNLYPEFGENIRAEWKFLDDKLKDAEYTEGMQTLFALRSSTPQVGIDRLDRIIQATEESGKDASSLKLLRQELGEGSPEEIAAAIPKFQLRLAMLDPTRFEQFSKAQLASEQARVAEGTSGSQIAKIKADADKAAIQARFAESQAVADLTQAGWNISKIQQDMGIARQNQAIAIMEAERKKTTDALRQQELTERIETAKFNRDQAVKETAAANENAYADIDIALQNINSILTTVKKDPDILRDIAGPIDSITPTFGGEEANLEEKINTLKSQVFLSQVAKMRGLGALTAAEGARLETNIASLSLRQTPEQIISNLTDIENVMMSGLERYRKALGLPEQQSRRVLREQGEAGAPAATSEWRVISAE